MVHRRGQCGNIVACKIHDLLRELCITMAEKENFLCVLRLCETPRPLNGERRIAIHGGSVEYSPQIFDALKSAPLVRSLIFNDGADDDLRSDFKLLKILGVIEDRCDVVLRLLRSGSKSHQQYVNLRYLHRGLHPLNHSSHHILKLPSSISRLWNLQTLILGGNIHTPPQIWEMLNLRHVICNWIRLPDPPSKGKQKGIILQKLQTLSEAGDFRVCEEVCARIPNIKTLRIFYVSYNNGYLNELKSLTKLESLTCEFSCQEPVRSDSAHFLKFPSSLVELYLIKCCLGWEDLTVIGSLPCLQVLKLGCSIKGNEWSTIEGEFKRLKYLEIRNCDDLSNWNTESSHFPVLVSLTLKGLTKLSEIPSGIGDIPTLERIELDECGVSAAISAMRILKEQESYGNDDLQLQVCFRDQEDCWRFREMVEEESLNTNHLCLVTI